MYNEPQCTMASGDHQSTRHQCSGSAPSWCACSSLSPAWSPPSRTPPTSTATTASSSVMPTSEIRAAVRTTTMPLHQWRRWATSRAGDDEGERRLREGGGGQCGEGGWIHCKVMQVDELHRQVSGPQYRIRFTLILLVYLLNLIHSWTCLCAAHLCSRTSNLLLYFIFSTTAAHYTLTNAAAWLVRTVTHRRCAQCTPLLLV